jgi:hypothetical protein
MKGKDAYSYYGTYSSAPMPPSAGTEPVDDGLDADTREVLEAVPGGRRARI